MLYNYKDSDRKARNIYPFFLASDGPSVPAAQAFVYSWYQDEPNKMAKYSKLWYSATK